MVFHDFRSLERLRQKQYGPAVFPLDSHVYRIGDRDCLLFVKGVFHGGPKKGVEEKPFGLRLIDFHFQGYEHHVLISGVGLATPSDVALRHQIVACTNGA